MEWQQPERVINQWTANNVAAGNQEDVDLAVLTNGNTVVVWRDGTIVEFEIITPAGAQVVGADVLVADAGIVVCNPEVMALQNGGFVVTYARASSTFPASSVDIYFRVYGPDGTPFGSEVLVNTAITSGNQLYPVSTPLNDGGFAVFWIDASISLNDVIRGQLYDSLGTPRGGQFLVEYDPFYEFDNLDAKTLPDGRIVLTFVVNNVGTGRDVVTRILDPRDGHVEGSSGGDTLYGSNLADEIFGLNGADLIFAMASRDWLFGHIGNDSLHGQGGEDTLVGGENDDWLYGGDDDDVLYGQGGVDRLLGEAGNDTAQGGALRDFIFGGAGNDVLFGQDGNDILYGGADDDLLAGGAGADELHGEGGDDTLQGGGDNDTLLGGDGNDLMTGDAGNDSLLGGAGLDTMQGGDGNDILAGEGGNDTLYGGINNDILYGQGGNDRLEGSGGADRLEGGALRDFLFGQDGNDTLFGQDGNDLLFGGGQQDYLAGGNNQDELHGEGGNDTLLGGGGLDTLEGGAGNDSLTGGAQSDTFVFAGGFGDDTITDFDEFDDSERIDLSGVASIVNFADLQANHMGQVGPNVVIDDLAGNTITVLNANIGDMNAADFVF